MQRRGDHLPTLSIFAPGIPSGCFHCVFFLCYRDGMRPPYKLGISRPLFNSMRQKKLTGSGRRGRSPDRVAGAGHRGGSPGQVTGAGHRGGSPGRVAGAGRRGRSPDRVAGAGHRGGSPGQVTGAGHRGGSPGRVAGAANAISARLCAPISATRHDNAATRQDAPRRGILRRGTATLHRSTPFAAPQQTPPMEKLTPLRWKSSPPGPPHRWKSSTPTDGKAHRRRAVASARRMPWLIFFGMRFAAAFRMLLSKSVRFL